MNDGRELMAVTINTLRDVPAKETHRWSEAYTTNEDMHIVALEHFLGVGKGGWSDNGHILSKSPNNPWSRWKKRPTAMEPTGIKWYFCYCGRDYYTEVGGIGDVTSYESFPDGHHFLVKKGETLYMHCSASNFTDESFGFHHVVRLIYW